MTRAFSLLAGEEINKLINVDSVKRYSSKGYVDDEGPTKLFPAPVGPMNLQ
jgi:hypothetical protein